MIQSAHTPMHREGALTGLWRLLLDGELSELAGRLALISLCMINLVNITMGEVDDQIEMDLQVKIKLAGLALAGCYGLWRLFVDRRLFVLLTSGPLLCFSLTSLILFLASATSLTPVPSAVSSASACVALVVTAALMLEIGPAAVARVVLFSITGYLVGSWAAWLLVPAQGVFREPIPGGEFFERMGGLSHPNTLGQMSGLAVVYLAFSHDFRRRFPLLFLGLLAMAGGALLLSASRTSLLACLVASAIGLRHTIVRSVLGWRLELFVIPLLLAVIAFGSGGLGSQLDEKITARFAKSGDADELTSLTGRSAIWAHTLKLVADRPLIGYGMATSKELLRDYSLYTHNMLLNVALSGGFLAAASLLAALAWGLCRALNTSVPIADALLWFLLLNGLTENVIFEFLASALTVSMVLALGWRGAVTLPAPEGAAA